MRLVPAQSICPPAGVRGQNWAMANPVIQFDARQVVSRLDALRAVQMRYAGSQALKKLGWELKKHHRQWMESGGFEKPVPFTLTSPRYSAEGLELRFSISTDGAKGQAPASYLYPVSTQDGAGRKPVYQTRFATFLQRKGITNMHPIPFLDGDMVRKNDYGNMRPSQYAQVKAGLKNTRGSSFFSTHDNRSTRPTPGWLKPGIYQRKGRSLFMLFGYAPKLPTVPTKYDWFGITDRFARENFPRYLDEALERAIR